MTEEGTVALLALGYNIGDQILLGGLNGLIGRWVEINVNGYRGPPHERLMFPCFCLLLCISINYPPV